jgi:hypothetical protein
MMAVRSSLARSSVRRWCGGSLDNAVTRSAEAAGTSAGGAKAVWTMADIKESAVAVLLERIGASGKRSSQSPLRTGKRESRVGLVREWPERVRRELRRM